MGSRLFVGLLYLDLLVVCCFVMVCFRLRLNAFAGGWVGFVTWFRCFVCCGVTIWYLWVLEFGCWWFYLVWIVLMFVFGGFFVFGVLGFRIS